MEESVEDVELTSFQTTSQTTSLKSCFFQPIFLFFLTFPRISYKLNHIFSPFFRPFFSSCSQEFDLDAFSSAQFQDAITQRRKAEDLSAVLYPNVPGLKRAATGMIHPVKLSWGLTHMKTIGKWWFNGI